VVFTNHPLCKFQHGNSPCFDILQELIALNLKVLLNDFNKLVQFQMLIEAFVGVGI
jgi:hypothetical protein